MCRGGLSATCGNALRLQVFCAQAARGLQQISLGDAGSGVCIYIHIHIYMPITSFVGPLLGFKKARSRGKDEKLRQEKAKMRKKTKH